MKIRLLLPIALIAILLVSCESEYQRQLRAAKHLINQEIQLRESAGQLSTTTPDTHYLLKTIQRDIAFHAHVSGNEEFFYHELREYERQILKSDPFDSEMMTTKYP
jgi:hypothetical protein